MPSTVKSFAYEDAFFEYLFRVLPASFENLYKTCPKIKMVVMSYLKGLELTIIMLLSGLFLPELLPYSILFAHPIPLAVMIVAFLLGFIILVYTHDTRISNAIVVLGVMICVFGLSLIFGGMYTHIIRHGIILFFLSMLYGEKGIFFAVFYNVVSTTILYYMEVYGYELYDDRSREEIRKILWIQSMYQNIGMPIIIFGYNRKQAQALADIEQANQHKTEFLCRMSHELRTPLVGIVGAIDILGSGLNITEDQTKLIQIARNCANNLLGIINDVLDFSKIEAQMMKLHVESINLREILETCAQVVSPLIASKPKVRLEVDFTEKKLPQSFLGDSLRIRQVLINLLSNAVKFTEQGTISVKVSLKRTLGKVPWTSTLSPRPELLRVPSAIFSKKGISLSGEKNTSPNNSPMGSSSRRGPKSFLIFSVADTGIGIDSKVLPKVFDAFEQGNADTSIKYGGSGLGLAITKRIIQMHGGDIAVVSAGRDQGATFYFYIPFYEDANEYKPLTRDDMNHNSNHDDESPDLRVEPIPRVLTQRQHNLISSLNLSKSEESICAPSDSPNGVSLLLAEDNKVNQLVIKSMLTKMNYQVDIANNGREAIEKTKLKKYQLIFMDIEMPEMNGLEAASALRLHHNPIPIIALTAHALAETRDEALKSGMNEVITKPCTFEQLRTACEMYIKNDKEDNYR